MRSKLPYNEEFEISLKGGSIIAPRATGGSERVKVRERHGNCRVEYLLFSPTSLQQQLTERAILVAERKRATLEPEAAEKLRTVINGTVDHIFHGEVRAFDEVTVGWISYAFNRVEFLVAEMIRVSRRITVSLIEQTLLRFCPLPPIC